MKTSRHSKTLWLLVLIISLLAALGYGKHRYSQLYQENIRLGKQISGLEDFVSAVKTDLASARDENNKLTETDKRISEALQSEQDKNKIFQAQINDISGTVGTLQKLSKTDPELLQKYSKVYFLSENYAPAQLSAVNSQYLYDKNKPELIHAGVAPFLQAMLAAAIRDGVTLQVVSAYRSFAEQVSVKTGYKILYGSGANKFSADQGYSEHQLGTAVDLTSPEIKGLSLKLERSAAYKWLEGNAYKFGFVLSYPKNNLYYQFEPWHWRFVGTSIAATLHNKSEYFYNLTQREIDQYLVSIFD